MNPVVTIARKRDGRELELDEISAFIRGYSNGTIPDYQMSALAMAIYLKGMTAAETAVLTSSMLATGRKLTWPRTSVNTSPEALDNTKEMPVVAIDLGDEDTIRIQRKDLEKSSHLKLRSKLDSIAGENPSADAPAPKRIGLPGERPPSTLLLDGSDRIDSLPEKAIGGRDTTDLDELIPPFTPPPDHVTTESLSDKLWVNGERLELAPTDHDTVDFSMIPGLGTMRPGLYSGPVVDKHSTGGLGDKTSLILAPLLACCGLRVPMISGRGLGPTGGTLDKLESIRGFRTNLSLKEIIEITNRIGCVITGASDDLAPVDRKLYALRDVTGTVASIPLITASIMSKKLAEGLNALVLDVKYGSGAFMKSLSSARKLAASLVETGQRMGVKTSALLTNMDQPLGRMVGNSLEVDEAVEVLTGQGPEDVWQVTRELGADLLLTTSVARDRATANAMLTDHLQSGRALAKFIAMVAAQGGDLNAPRRRCPSRFEVLSTQSGYVSRMNGETLGFVVIELGGGRRLMTDKVDHSVGLEMLVRIGEPVQNGQPIVRVYCSPNQFESVKPLIRNAIQISNKPVTPPLLVSERLE